MNFSELKANYVPVNNWQFFRDRSVGRIEFIEYIQAIEWPSLFKPHTMYTSQILSDRKSAAMNSIDERDLEYGASQLVLNSKVSFELLSFLCIQILML